MMSSLFSIRQPTSLPDKNKKPEITPMAILKTAEQSNEATQIQKSSKDNSVDQAGWGKRTEENWPTSRNLLKPQIGYEFDND